MQEDKRQHENTSSLAELRQLLADFATGELTNTQNARLQLLAIESDAAWRLYLPCMYMYGKIHQKHCNHDKRQAILDSLLDSPETKEPDNTASSDEVIFPLLEIESDLLSSCRDVDEFGASTAPSPGEESPGGFLGQINFSFLPGLIMIIASTLILIAVVILPIYWSTRPHDPKWAVVARITKTLECQWAQGERWSREGAFLAAGQLLDLEVGLVEIEFTSGTKVVLQGPAQFVVAGDNYSRLDLGRLTAAVPKGAEGFTVRTPGLDVIDLGTEFGVAVDTNGETDVHVFKGDVEMKVAKAPRKSAKRNKTHLLTKNEAVKYEKTSNRITSIPVDTKSFVRTLGKTQGITANLRLLNSSFEVPNIRIVKEYQPKHGNTLFRSLYGWKMSDRKPATSRVAMYQISPFDSPIADSDVGPGATDGRQVVVISLGVKSSRPGKPRSNWIYQSLGVVVPDDVGKALKLSVDAGPRSAYAGLPQGKGTVFAGFALHVNASQSGTVLGKPGSFYDKGESTQLHQLTATVPITVEMVGQELFVLLAASDNGSSQNIDEYHFDNVQLSVDN